MGIISRRGCGRWGGLGWRREGRGGGGRRREERSEGGRRGEGVKGLWKWESPETPPTWLINCFAFAAYAIAIAVILLHGLQFAVQVKPILLVVGTNEAR